VARRLRSKAPIPCFQESQLIVGSSLDIADLMRLFGNIEEGAKGRPFILVDNPTAAGGFFADRDHEGYADEF
jgi:hypothetical protein